MDKRKNDGASIMVVDDEEDTRTMLYELLSSEGYIVATAKDALEALKAMSRSRFDLVVSDLRMPMMEGIEFLDKIKAAAPSTKAIILTAYGNHPLYLDALEKGAADMLLKPVKNAELLRTVERVLAERGGRRG
ncbi:MAG: hypothetical protein A2Z34_08040 [Planctomycetes bacterium RBG_16_59_8]|nr:MAG: hypothetical protein A2Z34_08040 [Planctomycetes bacterium RBG_16_59_8]